MSPEEKGSDAENAFSRAIAARDRHDYRRAEQLLMAILASQHPRPAYFTVLGQVRWKQGDLVGAVDAFRDATELAPGSEEASLGLFHCLWERGEREDAFNEMRRFVRSYESDEYRQLLSELTNELGDV